MAKIIFFIFLLVISWCYFNLTPSDSFSTKEITVPEEKLPDIDDEMLMATFVEILTLQRLQLSKSSLELHDTNTTLFVAVESTPQHAPKEGITPLGSVIFSPDKIRTLSIGDIIALPPVHTTHYHVKVAHKKMGLNGLVTVTALLTNEEERYVTTITQGKRESYAMISTPEGTFQLEAVDGQGYLYAVNEIDKHYVDAHQSDILIP